MKSNFIIFSTMAFSLSGFAAQLNNSNTSTTTNENTFATKKTYTAAPTALYISKSPFDVFFGLGSEFLAPVEGTDIALKLSQSQLKIGNNSEGGKGTSNTDLSVGSLGVAHAFNTQFFVGAGINFGQSAGRNSWTSKQTGETSSSKSTSQGVSDPVLTVGGRLHSENVTTILALSGRISTGAQEDKDTSTASDDSSKGNLKSGANALTPSMTVHTNSSDLIIGGKLSYSIVSQKTSKDIDNTGVESTTKSTGGNIQRASLFLEVPKDQLSFGGSLDYTKFEGSKFKEENYEYKSKAGSFATATAFMNFNLSEKLNLIPSLSYGQLGQNFRELDKKDLMTIGVVGKSTF